MYTSQNFPAKKALKAAVAAGQRITLWAPGLGTPVQNGKEYIEGPHYPRPHTWYAEVQVKDGVVVSVK
jgi:hypothetical protein